MKRVLPFLSSSIIELLGLLLVIGLYWFGTEWSALPIGKELYLLEGAREALYNPGIFHPTYDQTPFIPVSPLLTAIVGIAFKLTGPSILVARAIAFVLSLGTLAIFYILGARMFHGAASALSCAFLLGTWGFFYNSHIANGATLFVGLVLLILILFFHWFDSAFRSRTYARSLYTHFIAIGALLGIAFLTYGLSGVLFPLLVMATTVYLSNRIELSTDIHYLWAIVPFLIVTGLGLLMGVPAMGLELVWSLFKIHFSIFKVGEPLLYLLPILPVIIPALTNKDIWGRALLSHQKALLLLASCTLWSFVFLLFFAHLHEAFSILAMMPVLIWLGYYLSEIFRNPLVPLSLQIVIDFFILAGLVLSVCFILLTFQIVPPELQRNFVLLSLALPVVSIILLFLRDVMISRILLLMLIPYGFVFCFMMQLTFTPLFQHHPQQTLARFLPPQRHFTPNITVLEWDNGRVAPSLVRFRTPVGNEYKLVRDQAQLESLIQTRSGPMYLVLPESIFYKLPYSVREMGTFLKTSWQWKEPLTMTDLTDALANEMVDFDRLSEPVILFRIPAHPES